MKLMIASDIHGSAYYCRQMLEAFAREGADRLMILGDVLYHGPRNDLPKDYAPKECIAMLNDVKNSLFCVRGNCDTEVDQMVLEFPVLADYALLELDGVTIYATHGHLWNEDKLPPMKKGTVLLNGHTHVPVVRDHGDFLFANPGSVSIPKEASWHGYMTLENGLLLWKDLEGTVRMEYQIS